MKTKAVKIIAGPADDLLVIVGDQQIFATAQRAFVMRSKHTLMPEGSAILLDASYWWFDSGREPETLRVERRADRIRFIGKRRIEQTHGDSLVELGDCSFAEWVSAVELIDEDQSQSAKDRQP